MVVDGSFFVTFMWKALDFAQLSMCICDQKMYWCNAMS